MPNMLISDRDQAAPSRGYAVEQTAITLFGGEPGQLVRSEREVRALLSRLEQILIQYPQVDLPLKHTFTSGVYAREIVLPKGTVIVGKIHRHDHLNFISYGDVTVLTKDGLQRLTGPRTMVSTAGTKRAVYVHEDTVWTTIHANPKDETDLGRLEDFIIAKNYDEFPLQEETAPRLKGYGT